MCETVNAIGTKRGQHKYEAALVAILNLAKRKRTSFDYLLLLGLWQAKFAKQVGGSKRFLCGIGTDGKRFPESCYALEMQTLKSEGVPIYLPGLEQHTLSSNTGPNPHPACSPCLPRPSPHLGSTLC